MAGALMQLVAYGAQDVYLTGNPQITFFKVVYKRHTNFAMELIQQTLSGTADFGNTVRCKISRAGDLLHDCWVNVTMPALAGTLAAADVDADGGDEVAHSNLSYCNRVGFRLLRSVELRVGGQQIDRHTSLWMHLWTELSHSAEKKGDHGLNNLVGNKGQQHSVVTHAGAAAGGRNTELDAAFTTPNPTGAGNNGSSQASNSTNSTGAQNLTGTGGAVELWVPLQFSFCRNPGLALPLIALQYHEVELVIELETFVNCLAHGRLNPRDLLGSPTGVGIDAAGSLASSMSLWGNYLFLDTEERKNFAQNPHEYLIETVQDMTTTATAGSRNYRLNFNHPVKELVWVSQRSNVGTAVGFSAPIGAGTAAEAGIFGADGGEVGAVDFHCPIGRLQEATHVAGDHTDSGESSAIFRGMVNNEDESVFPANSAGGHTGVRYGGDIFTDFTQNAHTAYLYATDVGNLAALATATEASGRGVCNAEGAVAGQQEGTANSLLTAPLSFPGTLSNVVESTLRLNGQERMVTRDSSYFNRVQPYQHHTGCPDLGINCYSFALKPEEHQPSGTCNFSRIDNAELNVNCANAGTLSVFAHGYNVLRVASGMGGLAYSN